MHVEKYKMEFESNCINKQANHIVFNFTCTHEELNKTFFISTSTHKI